MRKTRLLENGRTDGKNTATGKVTGLSFDTTLGVSSLPPREKRRRRRHRH